ncbi:hypothetical protein IJ556_04755 [bacterium]|nr:hypothetical protein [bacterium]
MYNLDIRSLLRKSRIFNYEVAAALGIRETSFSRIMARREMTIAEKDRIKEIINDIKGREAYGKNRR